MHRSLPHFILSQRIVVRGAALLMLAVAVGGAHAATRTVTTCADGGFGSLRDAVRIAVSGDVIDMSHLNCGRIALTRGVILIPQNDLTLVGPGRLVFTIDGVRISQMLRHTGTGTLRLRHLSLANGFFANPSGDGGCLHSEGNVDLFMTRVHHCTAIGSGALEPDAAGGGLFARGNALLAYSSVFSNFCSHVGGGLIARTVMLYNAQVYGNEAAGGGGGGVSTGELAATYSLIHGNVSSGNGGGINSSNITVNKSTISNNRSRFGQGGGIFSSNNERLLIIDSTISGNTATDRSAAYVNNPRNVEARIISSTIAFNHDIPSFADTPCQGALQAGPGALHLESTIVAGSTCSNAPPWDVGGSPLFPYPVIGSNNLIGRSVMPVPGDTISADPRLAPLAENGGPTRTHLLLGDSPAINRGHNDFDLQFDQRGPGFPRVKGAFPDIGAIER